MPDTYSLGRILGGYLVMGKALMVIAEMHPVVFVLGAMIVFMGWVWRLERKDKVAIIKECEDKMDKQRIAHKEDLQLVRNTLDKERERADLAHKLRNKDVEKITEAINDIGTLLAILNERISHV